MTDFETHPVGEIARLEAYLARRRKSSQTDFEDIHGYDAGCATEAVLLASDIEALIAALTSANAAAAAAYEVAARECDYYAKSWDDLNINGSSISVIAYAIRALATADQTAALDKLIAETVENAAETAAQFVHKRLYEANMPACSYHSREIKAAILAASKKGSKP